MHSSPPPRHLAIFSTFLGDSLLNYTEDLEKKDKIHWRKIKNIQWRNFPEIVDSVACCGRTCPSCCNFALQGWDDWGFSQWGKSKHVIDPWPRTTATKKHQAYQHRHLCRSARICESSFGFEVWPCSGEFCHENHRFSNGCDMAR